MHLANHGAADLRAQDHFAKAWEDHTADKLVGTQHPIADPKILDRLLHRPPTGSAAPRLEFWYNTKLSGAGKVRCAHCKDTYENHNIGYVLVYPNGDRICIGRYCGQAHYGQREFAKMLKAFETAKDTAYYERRRRAALAIAQEFTQRLELLEAQPGLLAYRDARQRFRKSMPWLEGVLRFEIARNGAGITYEMQVRDIAAEEQRDNKAERDAIRNGRKWTPPSVPQPIFRTEFPRFGTVVGADFYSDSETPSIAIASDACMIRSALASLKTAERLSDLVVVFKGFAATFMRIREQLARASQLPNALSDENFILLSRWAKERKLEGAYEAVSGALVFRSVEGDDEGRLELPATYRPPNDDALAFFEAALLSADTQETSVENRPAGSGGSDADRPRRSKRVA